MGYLLGLQRELARWEYKPGWRLRIVPDPGPWETGILSVRYETPDSRNPLRTIAIGGSEIVSLSVVEGMVPFGVWLESALMRMEEHELREWLRVDGELYDDPHLPRDQRRRPV
jgi:hypothetical protein